MVGVLTWCEFSERSIWTAFARRPMKKLQDMNNKMADLKEKAQVQAAAAAAAATAATQKTPLPALRQSSLRSHACCAGRAHDGGSRRSFRTSSPTAAPAAAPACPSHGTVQAGDRFCEHCGHKLVAVAATTQRGWVVLSRGVLPPVIPP